MMSEIKGNIEGYPDYFITSCGRVWSFKSNKFLKLKKQKTGYCYVDLYNENGQTRFYIHRLVAEAYISNPSNFDTVDHIDFNKENNNVNNLRWMSRSENTRRKKNPKRVRCIETGEIFDSLAEAARAVGRDRTNICSCLKGRQKTCGGFHWEYYKE